MPHAWEALLGIARVLQHVVEAVPDDDALFRCSVRHEPRDDGLHHLGPRVDERGAHGVHLDADEVLGLEEHLVTPGHVLSGERGDALLHHRRDDLRVRLVAHQGASVPGLDDLAGEGARQGVSTPGHFQEVVDVRLDLLGRLRAKRRSGEHQTRGRYGGARSRRSHELPPRRPSTRVDRPVASCRHRFLLRLRATRALRASFFLRTS